MISCLGAPTRHLLMPRDPFQLSSVVTSQYSKIFFWKKFPENPLSHSPKVCLYGLNMVFKVTKLTSKAVFHHFYQNILPLFTINWPLFFKMGKKSLFFTKKFISIFSGQCPQCATMSPMCNTFLGSLGVAHWVHPV